VGTGTGTDTSVRGVDSKEIAGISASDDAATNKIGDGVGDCLVPKPDPLSQGTDAKRQGGGSQYLDNTLFRRWRGARPRGCRGVDNFKMNAIAMRAKAKRKRLARPFGAVLDRKPDLRAVLGASEIEVRVAPGMEVRGPA
jgi:hypothetical protein